MIKGRKYGIDCLRFVLMFMVCILHVLWQGGILSATIKGTEAYAMLWFIETICYCTVDSFAFITGYTAKDNRNTNYSKLIAMWFQVLFYSLFLTLILKLVGVGEIGGGYKEFVKLFLPVTGIVYWYFTAYFILIIIKPFLNIVLFSLNTIQMKIGLIVLFALFSLQAIIGDPYQTAKGYSAIWLIVLYCMGLMARRCGIFNKYSSRCLIISYLISSLFSWASYIFTENRSFICYVSPTILFNGVVLVILFSRMKVGKIGKFISKNSRLSFGIYLFQSNPIIWNCVIKDAFTSIASSNIYIGVLQVFGYSFLIFASGLIVEIIRDRLFRAMQVDKLAGKVNDVLVSIASKSTVVLGCADNVDCKGK